MPIGTPNNGFIPPYPIRVDTFYTPRDAVFSPPALYLLSHTHVDHLTGLIAKSFGARVICSPDAKQMLLNMEPAADRIAFDGGVRAVRNRPYSHLKIDPVTREDGTLDYSMSRDLLLPVPLNTPRIFELSDKERVSITLLDANHCLGAVMFLVEGDKGAVLHTGDFRAEPAFLESLRTNPLIQRYLAPKFSFATKEDGPTRTLDAIYLDTACMLQMHEVPPKTDATDGLVQLMALFPAETRFFLNCWTWGYEDILKAVASTFQTKIHVDRYKYDIFMKTSDPFLKSLVSRDEDISRFHACERHDRCKQVNFPPKTESIVYVNPVDMSIERWAAYLKETRSRLEVGEPLTNLLVPLGRHSPLPELRAFVRLFRPKCVVPNTLDPALHGIDYAAMANMFEECLAPGGAAIMKDQMLSARMGPPERAPSKSGSTELRNSVAVQLENIVGMSGVAEDAAHWVDIDSMGRIAAALKPHLPAALYPALERTLSAKKPSPAKKRHDGSDYETTDDEQSYVASWASSSPLASRSQNGKMLGASSSLTDIPIAPGTPLRRQKTMPDVSPGASITLRQGDTRGKDAGPDGLGLGKPERTHSEPELTAFGTPYSSPARRPARQASKPTAAAVPRGDETKTSKAKVLGPSARPLSKQRELQARSSASVLLQRSSSTLVSVEVPTRSFSRHRLSSSSSSMALKSGVDGEKQPQLRKDVTLPTRSSTPATRSPSRASEQPAAAASSSRLKRLSREQFEEERPSKRSKLELQRTSDDKPQRSMPVNQTSRSSDQQLVSLLPARPATAVGGDRDPSAGHVRSKSVDKPSSSAKKGQDGDAVRRNRAIGDMDSQDSAVLRRTSTTRTISRTVTHEEVMLPSADDKKRKMKEHTRRITEMLRQAAPALEHREVKRTKTEVPLQSSGRTSEASRSRRQSVPAKPKGDYTSSRQSPEPPSVAERRTTLLTLHSDEPFGLEVTLPGVGFRFRDSQGEPGDVFDDV